MAFISPDDYADFDANKIVFDTASVQGDQGQKFHRIVIKYTYNNGCTSPLIVQTPILFSYGISVSKLFKKEHPAPQISLKCYNPDSLPTHEEAQFIAICEQILDRVKVHMNLDSTKMELNKWGMDNDVNNMKIFYIKMEKGKPCKGFPPTIYSKLNYYYDKDDLIITSRIDDANTGEPLPKKPLLGRSRVYVALTFANIFIGAKPSLQTKVGEVMVVEQNENVHHLKPLNYLQNNVVPEEPKLPQVFKLKQIKK